MGKYNDFDLDKVKGTLSNLRRRTVSLITRCDDCLTITLMIKCDVVSCDSI